MLLTRMCYAQWTAQDSLKLQRILQGDGEIKLNSKAIKQLDLSGAMGTPRMSTEKSWLMPDETLPEALPKKKVVLSLMPYKANTRYNWDPVYQKKIRVNKYTWREESNPEERRQRAYSARDKSSIGGSGVYVRGGTIGGVDLMAVFTKDFWDKRGRNNRMRALEVLRTYGDSTTVLINKPLEQIVH